MDACRCSHYVCFLSLERDVGEATRGNLARAIEFCSYAQESPNRLYCLSGAVQDSFGDAGRADGALGFCALLEQDKSKIRCYATVIPRNHQIYQDPAGTRTFCGRIKEIRGVLDWDAFDKSFQRRQFEDRRKLSGHARGRRSGNESPGLSRTFYRCL